MDIFSALPYLTGTLPKNPGPLARYLPPLPQGIAADWLAGNVPRGAWVLDPFGAAPRLTVEAARGGYRVLVAANNPVMRFLLETAAAPPPASDLRAALAELAVARKGEERLEAHLQALYLTPCVRCRREVPAEAFLWRRGAETPERRLYHCPHCKEGGEGEVTTADREHARELATRALMHRARALERVAALDDPDRGDVEHALDHYLPRAIYALITAINKRDSLPLSPERRRALTALLLSACDEANMLWSHPPRPRPRQLIIPPPFWEPHVWQAPEKSVAVWAVEGQPVPLALWPDLPPESGGICLFEGKLRDLAPHLKEMSTQAVICALPRPNQAFWTLSALWAGWLWGREAVAPFKGVLRRRRYDWNWHATALHAAFTHLALNLPPDTPCFALLAEPEAPFLSAALLAGGRAGFDLGGLAVRTAHDAAQVIWKRASPKRPLPENPDPARVRAALREFLRARGEPSAYLSLHAAGLIALAQNQALGLPAQPLVESLTQIHMVIQQALASDEQIVHYEPGEHNQEIGLWGLRRPQAGNDPLPDQVEMAEVNFLQGNPTCRLDEVERELYTRFPGLLTPSLKLTRAVLESYAEQTPAGWRLRSEDDASTRQSDLQKMAAALETIGQKLGFTVTHAETPRRLLLWKEDEQVTYAFYLLASAVVGRILWENPYPHEGSLIVLPGGRAGLLSYKLKRDPFLRQSAEKWRFLKFRHVLRLAEASSLTRETWERGISGDPIQPPEQMTLF